MKDACYFKEISDKVTADDDVIICGDFIRDVFEITKVLTENNI